jgi:hypothetical protein
MSMNGQSRGNIAIHLGAKSVTVVVCLLLGLSSGTSLGLAMDQQQRGTVLGACIVISMVAALILTAEERPPRVVRGIAGATLFIWLVLYVVFAVLPVYINSMQTRSYRELVYAAHEVGPISQRPISPAEFYGGLDATGWIILLQAFSTCIGLPVFAFLLGLLAWRLVRDWRTATLSQMALRLGLLISGMAMISLLVVTWRVMYVWLSD